MESPFNGDEDPNRGSVKRDLISNPNNPDHKRIKLECPSDIDDAQETPTGTIIKKELTNFIENDVKSSVEGEMMTDFYKNELSSIPKENKSVVNRKPSSVATMGQSYIMSEIRKTKLIVTESSQPIKTENENVCNDLKQYDEEDFYDPPQFFQAKRKVFRLRMKQQMEKDVGITEYIGEAQGFDGILKHRYSDFVVHEINLEGKTIHLTDTESLPIDDEGIEDEKTLEALLNGLLSEEDLQHLNDLKSNAKKEKLVIHATDFSKEQRTTFHKCIKKNFPELISMTTVNGDERKMEVWKRTERNDNNQKRHNWPTGRPNYTHFVLYKENKDTLDAINMLSLMMGMKPASLTYAGTKDKRAVTSQAVSVNRIEGSRLLALNSRLRNMVVGNISYKLTPLQLGDLSGNKFVIILRQVPDAKQQIDDSMKLLSENGFINYFGLQRFGTSSVSTHSVGRALILCKWDEAIDLILKPRDEEDDECLADCRQTWMLTKNPKLAINKLRWRGSIEGLLLQSMCKYDQKDFVNALSGLPRNMRLLYLHSFQSFVWNKMVSKRISKMGLKVVEGDLWMPFKCQNMNPPADGSKQKKSQKEKPLVVTSEDIQTSKVTIYDIVLPLPGHDVIYPQNEVKKWFEEVLAEDGMTLDSFDCKTKSYALGGSYRHILVKPKEVKWEILNYNERDQDLLVTDKLRLEGKDLPENSKNGKFKALRFEISLPSSCYATMAIRQVTRKDTSPWAQMQELPCS